MAARRGRFRAAVRHPRRLPAAALRRVIPKSPRYGFPWVHLPDGSVTFRESGFVAASSPSMLLARHNYEVARIHRELEEYSFANSLELGCGFGRLSLAFAQHSDHHVAVDINDEALQVARTTYPTQEFRHIDPGPLPFADNSFDLVVTWTVLQHVRPEKLAPLVTDIKRVLTDTGRLLLCEETRDPQRNGGHTWHRLVADYACMFAPLRLVSNGPITQIDAIPGMDSPGEVMVFRG